MDQLWKVCMAPLGSLSGEPTLHKETKYLRRCSSLIWLSQRPPHYSLSAAHFAFPMHILNADVLSSILFSWCKSKLANVINTEKLFVCLQFAYMNRQKTDWPTFRGNVLDGASKKLRGWCCWSCEENNPCTISLYFKYISSILFLYFLEMKYIWSILSLNFNTKSINEVY